jgi:hypothetical protein
MVGGEVDVEAEGPMDNTAAVLSTAGEVEVGNGGREV